MVHDLLAFLAERMLEMNKQKQKEIKGFLGWLESYLGAKVEDLTPKTVAAGLLRSRLRKLFGGAQEEPERSWPSIRPAGSLRSYYGPSSRVAGKLGPLRERIRQTDELIDAVVYRLYGLKEDEIRIVEGTKSN